MILKRIVRSQQHVKHNKVYDTIIPTILFSISYQPFAENTPDNLPLIDQEYDDNEKNEEDEDNKEDNQENLDPEKVSKY